MAGTDDLVLPLHISNFAIPAPKLPSPKVSYAKCLKEYTSNDINQSAVKNFVRSLDEKYATFTSALDSTVTSEDAFQTIMKEYLGALMPLINGPRATEESASLQEVDAAIKMSSSSSPAPAAAAHDGRGGGAVSADGPNHETKLPSSLLKNNITSCSLDGGGDSSSNTHFTGNSILRFAIEFSWTQTLIPTAGTARKSDAAFEVASALVAGAIWEIRRANTLCESSPSGVPSGPCLQAFKLLRHASGLLEFAATKVIIPLLKAGSEGLPSDTTRGRQSSVPTAPDICPEVLRSMALCALADAQGISVLRAMKKGNQPSLIAQLAVETSAMYIEAGSLLSTVPGGTDSKLAAYVGYKNLTFGSYAHIFNGVLAWKAGQPGAGLRCLKEAEAMYHAAKKASAAYDKAPPSTLGQLHRRFDDELDSVLYDIQRRIDRDNSAIYFQSMPSTTVPLPPGKRIAQAEGFTLPHDVVQEMLPHAATAFVRLPTSSESQKKPEHREEKTHRHDSGNGCCGCCACCGCVAGCIATSWIGRLLCCACLAASVLK